MKKTIVLLCVFALIGVLSSVSVMGADIYVNQSSASCSDVGSGTQAVPYCQAEIGIEAITSGDTLRICAGRYIEANDPILLDTKPFTGDTIITSCDDGEVVLENSRVVSCTDVSYTGHNLYNCSFSTGATEITVFNNLTNQVLLEFDTYAELIDMESSAGSYWTGGSVDVITVQYKDASFNPINQQMVFARAPQVLELDNVQNLKISNISFRFGRKGLFINDRTDNITLDNIKIISTGEKGLDIRTSSNITISNSVFSWGRYNYSWDEEKANYESTAIWTLDNLDNIHTLNSEFYGWFNGILYNSGSTGKFEDSTIIGNNLYDIYDDAIEIESYSNGINISNNNASSVLVGISLSPADSSQKGSYVSYNILVANLTRWFGGSTHSKGEVFKFLDGTAPTNFNFSQNTIIGRGIYAKDVSNSQINTNWINNLFYSINEQIIRVSGLSSDDVFYDFNLYFRNDSGSLFQAWNNDAGGSYNSLAAARASGDWDGTWDNDSVNLDPLFVNAPNGDFRLKETSPARNAGSDGRTIGALEVLMINPSFTFNQNNESTTTFNSTDVQINITVSDDSNISAVILAWNVTGVFVNVSTQNYDGSGNVTAIFNTTIDNMPLAGGTVGYLFWANDTLGNVNVSQIFTFTVQNNTPAFIAPTQISTTMDDMIQQLLKIIPWIGIILIVALSSIILLIVKGEIEPEDGIKVITALLLAIIAIGVILSVSILMLTQLGTV